MVVGLRVAVWVLALLVLLYVVSTVIDRSRGGTSSLGTTAVVVLVLVAAVVGLDQLRRRVGRR